MAHTGYNRVARTSALVTAVYWRFLEKKACAEPSDENSGLPEQTCNIDAIFMTQWEGANIYWSVTNMTWQNTACFKEMVISHEKVREEFSFICEKSINNKNKTKKAFCL